MRCSIGIREYLGDKLKLVKAEVSRDEITVEIESRGWTEEGTRMASLARDLYEKGAKRSALSMYRDALDLDPMNAEAMLRLGLAFAEQEKFADALSSAQARPGVWRRRRRAAGRDGSMRDRSESTRDGDRVLRGRAEARATKFRCAQRIARTRPQSTDASQAIRRCTEPSRLARTVRNYSSAVFVSIYAGHNYS